MKFPKFGHEDDPILLGALILLLSVAFFFSCGENKSAKECEAKGGKYLNRDAVCIKKENVL